MGNVSVYDKIINKGQEEAQRILDQGQEKADNITEQILNETDLKVKKIIEENDVKNADLVVTKKAEIEQSCKQKVLQNKKKLIEKTFNNVLKEMLNYSDQDLQKYVLSNLKKENINYDALVKVNKNEANRYMKLFSSKMDQNLDILSTKLGIKKNLKLDQEYGKFNGGFVLECENFDLDYSYEAIVQSLKVQLETEVANKLFGE